MIQNSRLAHIFTVKKVIWIVMQSQKGTDYF